MTVQAHRTTVSASTLENRRHLELGDRVVFIVEGVVTSVGVRRASDGDVEVRTVKASDLVEIVDRSDSRLVDVLTEARAARTAENDELAGRLGLFDEANAPQYVVDLDCGHAARYPEDWREREEHAEREGLTDALRFWEAQVRPVDGASTPCPVCDRETAGDEPAANATAVAVVLAASTVSGKPESDGVDGAPADVDVTVAPWETYDDDAPKLVRDRLNAGNAAHVLAYEQANRNRRSITGPAKALTAAATAAPADADDDGEERF